MARLGLGATEVAKLAGEKDSQGMRDVLSGRKRLAADLLGRIALACPIDALYVMTGMRLAQAATPPLSDEHKQLIDDYEGSTPKDQAAIRQLAKSVARVAETPVQKPARKRAAGGGK